MKQVPVQTENQDGLTIKIYSDENPESPREWDNLGTMVCFHKNYLMGDKKHGFKNPSDLQEKIKEKGVVSLPIYMMDHSGQTLSTDKTRFQACDPQGWDWGQIGYIFVEPSKILSEYGENTEEVQEKVLSNLNQEIETYNQYLQGDVYGFVIEDENEVHLDSCWGFYGLDYCLEEAKSNAKATNDSLVGSGIGI